MFGITIADAVLIGTLVISLLAAWRGSRAGAAAKEHSPPDPAIASIGSAIVDTATLRQLVESIHRLAEVIDHTADRAERKKAGRLADPLEEISRKLEEAPRKGLL